MILTVTLNPSLDEWMSLPSLRVGQLNRATGFARYPGGKGINVSRVVHELGGQTVAFGLAGGVDGLILRELMNRLDISHQFVTVQGSTRNNYKIHTRSPRALTEINAEGPRVTRTVLRTLQTRLLQQVPKARCIVLSGSLPPGAPSTIYREWGRWLRRRGILTVMDASGSSLHHGLAGRPWLIKPNRDEAQELLHQRLTTTQHVVKAVQKLLQAGPSIVILSLGKDGALIGAQSLQGVWRARSPVVKVDSAVGAGDSLIGGFLVGWARRQSLLEAFQLGVACGTATAMTPGTELCHRATVQRLVPHVHLRRVA